MNTGKTNEDDTYLKGKYHTEIYRENNDQLAIYFPSGISSTNKVLPEFDRLGIMYNLHIDAEIEKVYTFPENQLDLVHSVLNLQVKGKNIKPTSVKTARRQKK